MKLLRTMWRGAGPATWHVANRARGLWVHGSLLVATGCGDPLVDPTLIDEPRVIAVRVESADDPSQAELAPSGSGRLRVRVVANAALELSMGVRLCQPLPGTAGVPECERTFAEATVEGTTTEALEVDFELPAELDEQGEWIVLGAVCAQARVRSRSGRFLCSDGAQAKPFFLRASSQRGQSPNRNPELSDDELRFDGRLWPASVENNVPRLGQACRGLGYPEANAEEPHVIEFRQRGNDRETLTSALGSAEEAAPPGDAAAARRAQHEALVYTHLATLPGLERAFSAIDADDASRFVVPLRLPGDLSVDREGELSLLHWVVRDGRGGTDFTQRWFCALP